MKHMLAIICIAVGVLNAMDKQESKKNLAFYDFMRNRNLADVKAILRSGIDIDTQDNGGYTMLMSVAAVGDIALVQHLINKGANLDKKTMVGDSALSLAIDHRHYDTVRYLLRKKADPTPTEVHKVSGPLLSACERNSYEMVELLLTHGAKPGLYDLVKVCSTGYIQPLRSIGPKDPVEAARIAQLLLDKDNSYIDDKIDRGWTPLTTACASGIGEVALCLIRNGADVNKMGEEELDGTPLFHASKRNMIPVVKALLEHSANVNVNLPISEGATPVTIAASSGFEECVALLSAHADPYYLSTGLLLASRNGHLATVKLLLRAGADTDIKTTDGRSPYDWACLGGHTNVAKALTKKCAQCNARGLDFQKCAKCEAVYYCNRACQKKDWKKHKQECEPQSNS